MSSRIIFTALVITLAASLTFAQVKSVSENSDTLSSEEKEHRHSLLIESIKTDVQELRLSENRALAFADLGRLIWKADKEKANENFRVSLGELMTTLGEISSSSQTTSQSRNFSYLNMRNRILRSIADVNAEFALDGLISTRPLSLAQAMAAPPAALQNSNAGANVSFLSGSGFGSSNNNVQNEAALEQYLIRKAADQNPDKAVELIKEALKKDVTFEVVSLLQKLHLKDPEAAKKIGGEVVSKLSRSSFVANDRPDFNIVNTASSILSNHMNAKPSNEGIFRFEESGIRSLAEKFVDFYINEGPKYGYRPSQTTIRVAETFTPNLVGKLRSVQTRGPLGPAGRFRSGPDVSQVIRNSTSAAQLLSEASKLPEMSRPPIYNAAANRMASSGEIDKARSMLTEKLSGEALNNALASLNWNYINQLMRDERFAEAEALANELPERSRLSAFVSLANSAYRKDPEENKAWAGSLLEKARALLPYNLETNQQLGQLMPIIGAYANIDPETAFRSFEAVVPQLNEVSEASVIVFGFQGNNNVRQGEILISQVDSLIVSIDRSVLRELAKADFERTIRLLSSLSRKELRISLKHSIAQYAGL